MAAHGIIVYEIIDGCRILNGVFTHEDAKGATYTEMALNQNQSITNDVVGKYDITYQDGTIANAGVMEITFKKGVYKMTQDIQESGNKLVRRFEGIGFRSGSNHISFTYWSLP